MNRHYFQMVYAYKTKNDSWGVGNISFDIAQNVPNDQDLEYLIQQVLQMNPNYRDVVVLNVIPLGEPDAPENKAHPD